MRYEVLVVGSLVTANILTAAVFARAHQERLPGTNHVYYGSNVY